MFAQLLLGLVFNDNVPENRYFLFVSLKQKALKHNLFSSFPIGTIRVFRYILHVTSVPMCMLASRDYFCQILVFANQMKSLVLAFCLLEYRLTKILYG